jgi:hypothetical protein
METVAITAFLVSALIIAMVMAVLVFAIGLMHEKVITSMKGSTSTVKRASGYILQAAGIGIVVLAVWADLFGQILFPSP